MVSIDRPFQICISFKGDKCTANSRLVLFLYLIHNAILQLFDFGKLLVLYELATSHQTIYHFCIIKYWINFKHLKLIILLAEQFKCFQPLDKEFSPRLIRLIFPNYLLVVLIKFDTLSWC